MSANACKECTLYATECNGDLSDKDECAFHLLAYIDRLRKRVIETNQTIMNLRHNQ